MKEGMSDPNNLKDSESKSKVTPKEVIIGSRNVNEDQGDQIEIENPVLTKAFQSWLEILKCPAVGPFHAFTQGFLLAFEDILKIADMSTRLQGDVNEYFLQTHKATTDAVGLVYNRLPKRQFEGKEDLEEFRKIVIDAFEECFTQLFESKEFALVWNKLFTNQSELTKLIQNTVVERNLKMLNLPTRDEFDSILKDVHDLKRTVHDLRNNNRSNILSK